MQQQKKNKNNVSIENKNIYLKNIVFFCKKLKKNKIFYKKNAEKKRQTKNKL